MSTDQSINLITWWLGSVNLMAAGPLSHIFLGQLSYTPLRVRNVFEGYCILNWRNTTHIGEFLVEEKSKPDQITKLVAGDVLNIDEASYSTWTSPTRGKGK